MKPTFGVFPLTLTSAYPTYAPRWLTGQWCTGWSGDWLPSCSPTPELQLVNSADLPMSRLVWEGYDGTGPARTSKEMRGDFMVRRLLVGLVAAGLLLVGAPAFAQPPVTETTVQKNLVETFVDVAPSCEGGGPLYTITTTSNLIEHTTTFDDGRIHATFTQTGTFVAVPLEDPSLPSYTGKFTVWGGFNQSNQVVNGTFTFNVRGTGSDGSTFNNHVTDHFNQRPDGTVNEFFHCH
jgi:hypothetical protein